MKYSLHNDRQIKIHPKTGQYLQYDGITIVCNLDTDIKPFYDAYREALPKDCYTVLPLESMHMTLFNLNTLNQCNGDQEEYESQIQRYPRVDLGHENVTMIPKGCYVHGIQLDISCYDDQATIQSWKHHIHEKFNQGGCAIPNDVVFHMTLAYRYNNRHLTRQECQNIQMAFSLLPRQLTFSGPKTCTFKTMEAFTPVK